MTSTEQRDKVQRLKNLVLDDVEVRAWIASAWDELSHRLIQELSDPGSKRTLYNPFRSLGPGSFDAGR